MGKRGPRKGANYKANGLTNEVKVILRKRNEPQETNVDTARHIDPNLLNNSNIALDSERKAVERAYDKFETVFSELGLAKVKEWEKVINKGSSYGLWFFTRRYKDKENFYITFRGLERCCSFPINEFNVKWDEAVSYLRDGIITDWMVQDFATTTNELLRLRSKWQQEEETRKEILKLRGDEHLHIVSILNEASDKDVAYLVTGKEMFEQLNQREHDAIEMILASVEKDKNKP